MVLTRWLRFSVLTVFMIVCFGSSWAAVPKWTIVPQQSSIAFTGTLNDAKTSGKFNKFSGDIHFDPNQLSESRATITVDTSSLFTSYHDIQETIKTSDWLDVKLFPKATFKSSHFTKVSDKTFDVDGTLTIRDKVQPVKISFSIKEMSSNKMVVQGKMDLNRSAFGIGRGEWASFDSVKDPVEVAFTLTAQK